MIVRNQFLLRLKDGKLDEYKKSIANPCPELVKLGEKFGVRNISIWNSKEFIFGYFETENEIVLSTEDNAVLDKYDESMKDVYEYISKRGESMRLMFDAIGEPEESKEFIRKRAFMTKLDLGMQEEYKRRHDLLSANRPAPDPSKPKQKSASNNFTIWNASRYILGYQEINTLLEGPQRPPESIDNPSPWEAYMLQIMEWVCPFCGSMDLLYSRD